MPLDQDIRQKLDAAASAASEDVPSDDKSLEAFRIVAQWFKRHYRGAGYRRLSKVLMEYDVAQAGSRRENPDAQDR